MKSTARILIPVALLCLPAFAAPSAVEGDPQGKRNLAAESDLPRGRGLAAEFIADRGIASHSAVIFADDFEGADYAEKWDSARDSGGAVLALVDESAADPRLGEKSLRAKATLGENTGGGVTKWFESSDRLHIRFYTKFDEDCDYVHHFATLRANRSLRGKERWSGFGGAGLRPQGDERFSTALEPWGNRGQWPAPGRWNFYSYWHGMSASPDGKYWGNGFRPARGKDIPRGKWISCELLLVHNTPGEADGEQAFWIDGELRGHWKGIDWRKTKGLMANAFTLESYVTDRWTENSVNTVYFDNVVIAREYIGPSAIDAPKKD